MYMGISTDAVFCSQVLGIDAEFVSLAPAVKEPNPEVPGGPEIVVQAERLGLARVSVVRGGQTSDGKMNDTSLVPIIDDYIRAVEPVHDATGVQCGLVDHDRRRAPVEREQHSTRREAKGERCCGRSCVAHGA